MKPVKIALSVSNIYLLPCHNGYLQIDTGYPQDYARYRRNLARAGIALSDVRYLLLTHHHDDHSGFLNDITRDTNLTILAHEQAQALLLTGANDKSRGGGYVNQLVRCIADIKMRLDPHWTLTFPPFALREQDRLIAGDDDQWLSHIGLEGKILYTPGHSIDHIAVVLRSGEVFCGDAAASFPLWAGTKYCTIFMTNMDVAYQSWQKLLDAGGRIIYPAHGRPFSADRLRRHMGKIATAELVKFF
jgi:hydroxyacylglutathione hydrolase